MGLWNPPAASWRAATDFQPSLNDLGAVSHCTKALAIHLCIRYKVRVESMPTLAANGQRLDDEMPMGLQGTIYAGNLKHSPIRTPSQQPASEPLEKPRT